jgi:hypothetical protein
MTYHCDLDYGNHADIHTKLAALLNAASIGTLHAAKIVRFGHDRFLAYIVYE